MFRLKLVVSLRLLVTCSLVSLVSLPSIASSTLTVDFAADATATAAAIRIAAQPPAC